MNDFQRKIEELDAYGRSVTPDLKEKSTDFEIKKTAATDVLKNEFLNVINIWKLLFYLS